jgi:ribosomal protein L11|uniref:ribosomal protein L11 n=1 Tax=Thecamoeba quadrilineata TaxID=343530 RepID=UPI00226C67DE|nr:ribosomal protein L11 [Thecamoeba quadrilineata]UZN43854.1 ribosomal protein L11 [Thecamoeba quadrilineata]
MNNNIFYTHYNRKNFLATFKKELTIILPAQEIKAVPPLSQVFTQVGLNTNEVCEKFNKLSKIFPTGVLIPTSIFYTPKEKNFEICFRPFQLKLILQQYIELITPNNVEIQNKYQISILNLYKVLIIKGFILNEKNLQKLLRSIFGTLRSYDYPVEITYTIEDIKNMLNKKIINETQLSSIINNLLLEIPTDIENNEEISEIDVIDFILDKEKKENNA